MSHMQATIWGRTFAACSLFGMLAVLGACQEPAPAVAAGTERPQSTTTEMEPALPQLDLVDPARALLAQIVGRDVDSPEFVEAVHAAVAEHGVEQMAQVFLGHPAIISSIIDRIFTAILGRLANLEERSIWFARLLMGQTTTFQLACHLLNTDEYRNRFQEKQLGHSENALLLVAAMESAWRYLNPMSAANEPTDATADLVADLGNETIQRFSAQEQVPVGTFIYHVLGQRFDTLQTQGALGREAMTDYPQLQSAIHARADMLPSIIMILLQRVQEVVNMKRGADALSLQATRKREPQTPPAWYANPAGTAYKLVDAAGKILRQFTQHAPAQQGSAQGIGREGGEGVDQDALSRAALAAACNTPGSEDCEGWVDMVCNTAACSGVPSSVPSAMSSSSVAGNDPQAESTFFPEPDAHIIEQEGTVSTPSVTNQPALENPVSSSPPGTPPGPTGRFAGGDLILGDTCEPLGEFSHLCPLA